MKILLFLTVLINLSVFVITQGEEPPTPESDEASQDDAVANNMCGNGIGPTCANDCKTLMVMFLIVFL